jgi:Na+-driven multidrug efflux pump
MIPLSVSISLFVEGSHNVPLRESTLKSIKFSLMLLLPIVLFIFLFGGQILMIYNKEYAVQSFQILKFLALASIFQVLPCIYISIKKVTRDIRTLNALNLASSVLLICAGYVSLLKYGLIGMGYTWLGLNIAMSIAVIVLAIKWDKMIVFRASDLIAFMPGKNFISACISKMVNLISGLSSGLLSWLPF